MVDCRDIEPLLAGYVDRDITHEEREVVTSHLGVCARCHSHVAAEEAAHDVLRRHRAQLGVCAPERLRARCADCLCDKASLRFARLRGMVRRAGPIRIALAATLLLATAAIFFAGAGGSAEVLAAQFAMDHLKCFQLTSAQGPLDAVAAADSWKRNYGWPVAVPQSAPVEELELVEVRRCLSTEGFTAHIMYRWRGAPLSLFVLNSVPSSDAQVERLVSRIGHDAVLWSDGGRTYAVVGRGQPSELKRVAHYVRTAVR